MLESLTYHTLPHALKEYVENNVVSLHLSRILFGDRAGYNRRNLLVSATLEIAEENTEG